MTTVAQPPTMEREAWAFPNRVSRELPRHLADWRLPPNWRWGAEGVWFEHRHYQEVIDALGRSLSLVTAPHSAHAEWLEAEARLLAHQNHPSIPTTFHYWTSLREGGRGPGYLRRWLSGESVGARIARQGPDDLPSALHVVRAVGSTIAYLHDSGVTHGALSPQTVWVTPTGRIWLLAWQWSPRSAIPAGLVPERRWMPIPPEWADGSWQPTPASDQWQLAALCFAALTGELPPSVDVPPLRLVQPDCPQSVASIVDRALLQDPERRHRSVTAMLRALDRGVAVRTVLVTGRAEPAAEGEPESEETRLRWAVGDDYEVLASLGSGTFGSVWRVRDLTLGREAALKMLHPWVARDERSVTRFRREARLAAELAHPAIVPIYDWDSRGDTSWYTMELAEGGSLADTIARAGARGIEEIALQVEHVLSALATAHANGIVHRDLKPENILIDRYGRWRLTDFGIANVTGEETGGATGTPAFAAPEQLLGEPHGPAADCFALAGIVLYATRGVLPFGSGDTKTILARQLAGPPESVAGYPPEVAAWLERALAPTPEARFADATEMLAAWQRAMRIEAARWHPERWWQRLLVALRLRRVASSP